MKNKAFMLAASLLVAGGPQSSAAATSPYAPSQIIPAKAESGGPQSSAAAPSPRRARPPRERRREGNIPGIVTIPYGKTAAGERTHIYRIMGQGGVVADFTDYGARLVRLYAPDATADLANILEGFKPSVLACEKAGDLAEVWKMTPIRRPRATGLVFEREVKGTRGTKETKGTNSVASVSSVALVPSPRVVYWLDAANQLTIESTIADTNAVKWVSSLAVAPLKGRRLEITDSLGTRALANTTNTVSIALPPGTNVTEKISLRFMPGGGQ